MAGHTSHPYERPFPTHHDERPRVLVETADGALLISDYRFLADDGFEVGVCAGPSHDGPPCPLLRGEECELVTKADVVLHGLDPDLRIVAAIKRARPELPVLVQGERQRDDARSPIPAGSVPLDMPCSLGGQLDAIRRVMGR